MGARSVPEQRRDARQGITGDFERHDRVLEGCRLRITRDRIDLGIVFRKRHLEGRRKIAIADPFELRQTMRPLPVKDSRIESVRLSHA